LAAQHYGDAVEFYTRAQARVPQEQRSAYAYLWCQMAEANLALQREDVAVMNLQTCIDWTQGDPGKADLRALAEDEIRAISGGEPARPSTDPYADRVVEFGPGPQANESCIDPSAALGHPDFNADQPSTFVCFGLQGHIVLEFVNNVVVNGPGADLVIRGDPENNDSWHVDLSQDGTSWVELGPQPEVVELDLAAVGLERVRFVRLTDTGAAGPGTFAGAELDAVEALHSEPAG
jgi:hypothetical protein